MTGAVVRKELTVLWLSPLPYVVGALFHVVLGILFVDQLEVRRQAVLQPLFPLAGFLLVALSPVLTMRALADEERSGTLDVLQAIPVRARVLVAGKWLAAWITAVVVVAPAALLAVLVAWWGDPDLGPVAAGFAGLALLGAALAALGVLASALTASQPVAAVVAFFVGLLLWFAHAGGDAVTSGSVLARVSTSERLRSFASGVLDTADIGFFAVLTAAGVVLAVVAVEGRRLR